MATEELIRAALVDVIDPEIRRSIVELGMVRGVELAPSGDVRIGIALTVPGCPLKATIERDVVAAARRVEGVRDVQVAFTHMTEEERRALSTQLRGGAAGDSATRTSSVDPRTRVLAIASGKGGVGKSSLAVNLAAALRARGNEVGVLDADIYGFSIPGMLGVDQRPVVVDRMIVPPVAHELKTISIGYFLDEGGAVLWRGPMLHKALEQFLSDVHWGPLDYLVVDMPPGTGDVAISLGRLLPRAETIVVTTPQPAAQRVAERAAAIAVKLEMPVIGVIENMSYRVCPGCGEHDALFGAGGGAALAATCGVPLLGQVPLETALRTGADDGVPVVIADPDAPAARVIAGIAEALDGARPAPAGAARIRKALRVVS